MISIDTRFWSKVDKNGPTVTHCQELGACWVWIAGCYKDGYGNFGSRNETLKAHRVSWELTFGAIPDGLWVLHKCDNRRCVNPGHLYLGTAWDNARDMVQRCRYSKRDCSGEHNGRAKLSRVAVEQIRELYRVGSVSYRELAARYGVSERTIGDAITGMRWAT